MAPDSKRGSVWSRPRWIAAFVVLLLAHGCDLLEPEACTTIALAGVVVNAFDETSGSLVGQGLSGTLEDGDYHEEMLATPAAGQLVGAWERPGVYAVTVAADGYSTTVIEGVRVEDGSCHVRTQELTVDLEPAA